MNSEIKANNKPRVLYIDDEKDNLVGFKYMFRKLWDITTCNSGVEALEILKDQCFDVIFSDHRMPEITGVELFEKTCKDHPDTVRIILTGYADIEAVIDAVNKGKIYYYLQKPWDEEEVKLIVTNALETQRLERKLIENEKRFRDIAESSGDWIWELNENGVLTYTSGNVSKILGYDSDDLLGKKPIDLLAFVNEDEKEKLLAKLSSEEKISDFEYSIMKSDGLTSYLIRNGVPIFNSDNECIGYRGVDKDISERRILESELRQSEKMTAVGQLAGGIAHDFNNQLGAILGFADLLSGESIDDSQQEYVSHIVSAVNRSSQLTKQLLAFSRKGHIQKIPVDMNNVIAEVISILQHSIDKKIEVINNCSIDPMMIIGDPSQLQNAILNLGINSRDAMPHGGSMTFTTEKVDGVKTGTLEDGSYVKVTVSDTGYGMDRNTVKRAFEPFFTTKPEGQGTGMGLAGVYGTVQTHNGEVVIDSRENKGTTFILYFPLDLNITQDSPKKSEAVIHGHGKILFIDDEEMLCMLAKNIIAKMGYEVTVCRNGKQGIEMLQAHNGEFDLVICDLVMPGMDGLETILEMMKIKPSIRAVISSGYGLSDLKGLPKAIVSTLTKPYTVAHLSSVLQEVFS